MTENGLYVSYAHTGFALFFLLVAALPAAGAALALARVRRPTR